MRWQTETAGPNAKRGNSGRVTAVWLSVSLVCTSLFWADATAGQDVKTQQSNDGAVRVSMHNVKYRFAESVSVQVNYLNGAFVPVGDHTMPVADDKNSFKIHIDTAEIAMSPEDLANLLNQFVFSRPGSPLSDISVRMLANEHLSVKGRLKDKGNIPFETEGALVAAPDGKLKLHAEKVKALKIPVKGLMDAFGIEVGNLIKSGQVPGVAADGNDLIFDLEQMLPAPRIDGRVTKVRVEQNTIVQTFSDGSNAKDATTLPKYSGNYMALRGNSIQVGKLTMQDTDIVVFDMDPADPLDFFLDRYKEQLAAGYTKITTRFQVREWVKDFGKLGQSKKAASAASTAPAKN
jgi:hypothetical protein